MPYQLWMLQRVERVIAECVAGDAGRSAIESFLDDFDGGPELLGLETLLTGCRIRKEGARLFSADA
jgi:hypothetical protein